MPLTVKQGLRPPDGYWFQDADKVVHRAKSWMELIRKLAAYRARNKFELGDPMAEVISQAAKRWPDGFYESFPARNVNIYAARRPK